MRQIGMTNYVSRPMGYSPKTKSINIATHGNKSENKGK
jgi:hypothetical protein